MKTVLTKNIVNEINLHDELEAYVVDDQTIEVFVLVSVGNELVYDFFEKIFGCRDYLKFADSDEASSVLYLKLCAPIFEKVEGGIIVFDSFSEYESWFNQK